MTGDEYLQTQLGPLLQPGEQVLHTAYMRRQPGILVQAFFFLIAFLLTKAYFAVLTNRRLLLIRTKMGAWTGVQNQNLGVEQYDVRTITKCSVGGIANNKSMTFHMASGDQTLRISPWFKSVKGTAAFHDMVPNLINSGQLQQMATGQLPPAGMGQLPPGQPMQGQPMQGQPMQQPMHGQPMQQPMAPPMQQPMMMQQPQQQAGQPLQVGMAVMVSPGDGQRYPATIVQANAGQYLCQMPNGQPYWFSAQQVSVG
ncbi:MAG: hypothetical protein IPQ07_23400 [Myxococcales bacterium]|nr:hypothetical protein [Myxococcales bacterium]